MSSVKQALDLFKKGEIYGKGESFEPLARASAAILFFQPSIPPEENIHNRQMIIEGLKELARTDRKLWRKIVDMILSEWRQHHRIRRKHFSSAELRKDWNIMYKIDQNNNAGMVMSQIMQKLLESTGK